MTYCILLDLALWQLCPLPYSINLYYYPQGLSRVVPHRVKGNTRLAPVCAFELKRRPQHMISLPRCRRRASRPLQERLFHSP